MKQEGAANDLLDRLRNEKAFAGVDFDAALDPQQFVGRAPEQVEAFVGEVIEPIRQRYAEALKYEAQLQV